MPRALGGGDIVSCLRPPHREIDLGQRDGDELGRSSVAAAIARGEARRLPAAGVKARFDAEPTADYGRSMRRWLPDHDEAHGLLLELVLGGPAPPTRILDLGAGTGRLAAMVLSERPDASVVLLDYSANMLGEVPVVLEAHAGRWTTREADLFSPATDLGTAEYDVVVSSLALHHGRSTEEYADLYRRVAACLRPGGRFVCLDHVAGADPETTLLAYEGWARQLRSFAEPETVLGWLEATAAEDTPLPLAEHGRLLAEAGLVGFDAPWRRQIFALYTATRTA